MAIAAYVHIPFCRQRCFYCDFPIAVVGHGTSLDLDGWIGDYVEAVCSEIRIFATQDSKPLSSIFFGGGTPSLLPVQGLARLLSCLDQTFGITLDAEISMEIDPGTFTLSQLHSYQALGLNRFSLGVQAFQDNLLSRCGRLHRRRDIDQAITWIAQAEIKNWSLDLISGLPEQTLEDWQESLKMAITAAPAHLSCYDLVLEPTTAFGKQWQPGEAPLPEDITTATMYRQAQKLLTQAGYDHYEISNYAKLGHQCRHNRVYWQNQSYYGFGLGATSYLAGKRFGRPRTRGDYYQWVKEFQHTAPMIPGTEVDDLEKVLETLMVGLRLAEGVRVPNLTPDQRRGLFNVLEPYQERGWLDLLTNSANRCETVDSLTRVRLSDPEGFLFSNTILTDIFELFS